MALERIVRICPYDLPPHHQHPACPDFKRCFTSKVLCKYCTLESSFCKKIDPIETLGYNLSAEEVKKYMEEKTKKYLSKRKGK